MKYYQIEGSKKLSGQICVENSKNAILPIIASTILISEEVVLKKVPNFIDVNAIIDIISHLGKTVKKENDTLIICGKVNKSDIPKWLCEKLRASVFLLGSLIAVFKQCSIFMPGGCDLGARPIDYHINGLKILGVNCEQLCDKLIFSCSKLTNGIINLPYPSVGATINLITASVFTHGETFVVNAAKEPEIVDLSNFLIRCGAKIYGAGSSVIRIVGVKKLYGCTYTPVSDRIVAGTYLLMAAATRSKVEICNFNAIHNKALLKKLLNCGCSYSKKCDTIYLKAPQNLTGLNKVVANVYPDFPTDLQSLMLSFATTLNGESIVCDKVFPNRFNVVNQLQKMNANIVVNNNSALIKPSKLLGSEVSATDLRAGAGLILAGLVANGTTQIYNTHYIERGYENIVPKLKNLGANICEKEG